MPATPLTAAIDAWTVQAVMASAHLVKLYRALGDEHQLASAAQSLGHCGERAQRQGLHAQVAEAYGAFMADQPDEIQGEARAWQMLVEAQAGLAALYGLVDQEPGKEKGLQGARTVTNKAFQRSMRGYCVAFPEEIARTGILAAIEQATDACADAFSLDVVGAEEEEKLRLREDVRSSIKEALMREARVVE